MESVKLSKIEAALAELHKHHPLETDIDVPFEYLVGSFYPNIMKNIHDEVEAQYHAGFMEGYKMGKEDAQK